VCRSERLRRRLPAQKQEPESTFDRLRGYKFLRPKVNQDIWYVSQFDMDGKTVVGCVEPVLSPSLHKALLARENLKFTPAPPSFNATFSTAHRCLAPSLKVYNRFAILEASPK
jgi:hypothetical protein